MTDLKKDIAKDTRWYRKIHRYIGSYLLVFFFVVATTGLLLGWKKHSGGFILPNTEKGSSTDLSQWVSLDTLQRIAQKTISEKLPDYSITIDRIDVRPDKGTIKVSFKDHYNEVQLDGATGKVLAINVRKSDIIEQIHDGSILDFAFKNNSGTIKLGYTSVMGLGLIILTISGFWLWYNPKRIRKIK
ncbi:MAG TPA: PepSY-associated TM helix domain-containing protein [Cyclobacteriaceae bacterium]